MSSSKSGALVFYFPFRKWCHPWGRGGRIEVQSVSSDLSAIILTKTHCLLSAYSVSGTLHALLGLTFFTQYHLESPIPPDI